MSQKSDDFDFDLSNMDDLDMDLNLDDIDLDMDLDKDMTLMGDDEFGMETKEDQPSLELDDLQTQNFNSSGNTTGSSAENSQPVTVTPNNDKVSIDPKKRSIRFRSPLEDSQVRSPSPLFVSNGKKVKETTNLKPKHQEKTNPIEIANSLLTAVPMVRQNIKKVDCAPLKKRLDQEIIVPKSDVVCATGPSGSIVSNVEIDYSDALKENSEAAALYQKMMGDAANQLNAFKYSAPDIDECVKMEEKYAQLKTRAEAAALKTAAKRQELRDLNERREAVLNRINSQRQRQATIKERLQAKLKKRNEMIASVLSE